MCLDLSVSVQLVPRPYQKVVWQTRQGMQDVSGKTPSRSSLESEECKQGGARCATQTQNSETIILSVFFLNVYVVWIRIRTSCAGGELWSVDNTVPGV